MCLQPVSELPTNDPGVDALLLLLCPLLEDVWAKSGSSGTKPFVRSQRVLIPLVASEGYICCILGEFLG